jgi:hypothetical protein
MADNPFAVVTPPAYGASSPPRSASNPFDPMAPMPADPFASAAPIATSHHAMGVQVNGATPFDAPAQQPQSPPPQTPFAFQQQQLMPQNVQSPHSALNDNASVPSQQQQQMNLYAATATPFQQQSNPYGNSLAIVSATQQNNQWALSAPTPSTPFDPFVSQQTQQYQQSPFEQQQYQPQPLSVQSYPTPPQQSYQQPQALAFNEDPQAASTSRGPSFSEEYGSEIQERPVTNQEIVSYAPPNAAYEFGQKGPPDAEELREKERDMVNPYREELAREAPPGASPLPKPALVRKKGYVLSRISFRTIVMKKWKQSFWVQYGPHTMLWFRSEDDFNDWLNNP